MLLDGDGVPLFDPTVWSATQYRSSSSATMEQALRGAMLIHLFCWRHGIDLIDRVTAGTFFDVGELDALAADASKPFSALHRAGAPKIVRGASSPTSLPLEGKPLRRLPSQKTVRTVAPETTRIRLHYAARYLGWLGERQRSRQTATARSNDAAFVRAHQYGLMLLNVIELIEERTPPATSKGRQSLEPHELARLLSVTDPDSPENIWTDPFVRLRNWLIVRWLLGTGMRRGELLGMHVKDFNRAQAYCEIKRRHDDQRDKRRRQPNAKTLERLAPLDECLVSLGEKYLAARRSIDRARKHAFLVVADDGTPLSKSAISAMFLQLRKNHPGIGPVSAHVLRHQWNEDFSAYADSIGMDSDEEVRERSWLMGWSRASKMPWHYLKRRTKAKADEHVKAMQRRLMSHAGEIQRRIQIKELESAPSSDEISPKEIYFD